MPPAAATPKRYLDVEELLSRGIDVYTTINVQHVESLNDVVAQITRVRVRETVPDSIIDRADDIEVIDITPDDLLKRLHDGKVYVPTTARRAVENYFSPGNLTALRELALRRTAQRVDDQLLSHMQSHAIAGPWAAGERVLVCIDEHARGPSLVRYARRLADRLRGPFVALNIETARTASVSDAGKDQLAASLRLAEQLGGEAVVLPGQHIATEIVRYAAANNVTHIVIGKPQKPQWREWLQGSVSHELIRHAGDISVHVIAGAAEQGAKPRGGADACHATAFRARSVPVEHRLCAGGAGRRAAARPGARRHQYRAGVPDGGAGGGAELRARGGAVRLAAQRLCAQLLLSEAALHAQYQRSRERHRARLLPRGGVHRFQPDFAGAAAGRGGAAAGPHHRGPLSVLEEACRPPVRSTMCCGPPPTRSPRC